MKAESKSTVPGSLSGTGKNKHAAVGSSSSASAFLRPKIIACGPGLRTIALGIGLRHNGIAVCENCGQPAKRGGTGAPAVGAGKGGKLEIWLEDRGVEIPEKNIIRTARIGVDYAGEHALLPWRFKIAGNKFVSR